MGNGDVGKEGTFQSDNNRLREMNNKSRSCQVCGGRLIASVAGGFICSVCGREEQDDYGKVWDYISEYGPSSIYVIHVATGVSEEVIEELLSEGKLGETEIKPVISKCERCGREIKSGRMCLYCTKKEVARLKTQDKVYNSTPKAIVPQNSKMRYLGHNKH